MKQDLLPPIPGSIDQLRNTFVAVLKLYLIALGETPPSQSGTLGKSLLSQRPIHKRFAIV